MQQPDLCDHIGVIDADTHVVEPYDLWTSRMSAAKWGDLVPHVRHVDELDDDIWFAGDTAIRSAGETATAGWHEWPPAHPRTRDETSPDLWDAGARLARMDRDGIRAQVLYPNVPGFGAGKIVAKVADAEFNHECLRAYNDWQTDWSSADPQRLVPVSALPFWDLELSIREMQRTHAMGHRGVIFTNAPQSFDQPPLGHLHWDRLWAAAQELGMPINFHISSANSGDPRATFIPEYGVAANFAKYGSAAPLSNYNTIADLIFGGVCHRFPDLKFVSVESGVGWIPFALALFEWQWSGAGIFREHPEYDLTPTEYFKRQIYGCFWFETDTLTAAVDILGPDNFLYESDFPHPVSMSVGVSDASMSPRAYINAHLTRFEPDVARKLLHDNAAKLYRLDEYATAG